MSISIGSIIGAMTMDETIKRINELAHKAKTVGLTEAELKEREELRNIYRRSVIGNLRAQLDNTSIRESDGSIRPLKQVRPSGSQGSSPSQTDR